MNLEEEIEKSKEFLTLEDDRDKYGGKEVSQEGRNVAISFLRKLAEKYGDDFPVPWITPCSEHRLDLYWKTDNLKLLIAVGSNGMSYFGSCKENEIKGGSEDVDKIVAWMKKSC